MVLLMQRCIQTLHKVLPRVDLQVYVLAASVFQGGNAAAVLSFHILTNAGTAADQIILLLPRNILSTLRCPTLYYPYP
jgi:hypothetical protein